MTFMEAAIEVLRHATQPLHFSKIAEEAVRRNLLSHVGRDPEAAMRTCLSSAVRAHDAVVTRVKPGVYEIRPGAKLPDPPPEPEKKPAKAKKTTKKKTAKKAAKKKTVKKTSGKSSKKSTQRRGSRGSGAQDEAEAQPEGQAAANEAPEAGGEVPELSFVAPDGSGLDGVTDVALVMANAMSRLADERPELREELEAMQAPAEQEPEQPAVRERSSERQGRRSEGPRVQTKPKAVRRRDEEERPGRRRRRRRRRSKRVDWSDSGRTLAADRTEDLLDKVEGVLGGAGPRSLHVRQIAETLAEQDVLGGEISEIERAVTAALIMDVHRRGESSRFCLRGDARYQLQGGRIPEAAAKAERALRKAAHELEGQTRRQMVGWLSSLGTRGLEAIVRLYLEHEGLTLEGSLPPTRGVSKLLVEDPDAEGEEKLLVVVIPSKTDIEARPWEGDVERGIGGNEIGSVLVFALGGGGEEPSDGRMIRGPELADWLLKSGLGVRTVKIEVPTLDATMIESIGGLDT